MFKYNNYSDKEEFVKNVLNDLISPYEYNAAYYNKSDKVEPLKLPYDENIIITDSHDVIVKVINVSMDNIIGIIKDFYKQFFEVVMQWGYYDGGDN